LEKSNNVSRKDRHSNPRPSAQDRKIAFSLTKVNDRGRKQNRTLSFQPHRVEGLRGDTVRFTYEAEEVHGIMLHPEHSNVFKLACVHYYEYECETEAQRNQVDDTETLAPRQFKFQ
jgi:plastocyanin